MHIVCVRILYIHSVLFLCGARFMGISKDRKTEATRKGLFPAESAKQGGAQWTVQSKIERVHMEITMIYMSKVTQGFFYVICGFTL